ncbi:MAG: GNAT family N-acetyltransferase [Polaribacter sp.]|nr:GNAT family N-acetyltransferase [Polaribacter sp.]MDG1811229.1 GNAT family N-acetyltransferase [Polaribacter sp.]MDG1993850.1 GNAT family N-acetyltransferase [Polaribacter sp.]
MNFPATFPELQTERLFLRQLNTDDVNPIFELRSSKEVNKLITREIPKDLEEATEFINICYQEFEKQNSVFWVMQLKETNELIGTIVYHNISLDKDYAEIGYELNAKFYKKGFMNEAIQKVISFGIKTMSLKVIEAFTHQNNIASIALLEKHNFVYQPDRRDKGFENNRIFKLINNN